MKNSDYEQVLGCMRRIGAVIHAHTDDDAKSAVRRLLYGPEDLEVVFSAVQALRDLDTITEIEAVFLFHELFKTTLDEGDDDDDPEREADFLRERGETYLAYVRLAEEHTWWEWLDDGQFSLIDDRREPDVRLVHGPSEADVAAVAKQLTQLVNAARANEASMHCMLKLFAEVVPVTLVRAAVRAVARCREDRVLSDRQARLVVEALLAPVVGGLLRSDREWRQVQMEIARYGGGSASPELAACELRRWRRVWVHCLRVCGEHEWADAELHGLDRKSGGKQLKSAA